MKAYIEETETIKVLKYNPNYGDSRLCSTCDHRYDRHFDSYDNMKPVGCKYCDCFVFEPSPPEKPEG